MDIRPAATLVLTRDTANGIEVLLLQRTWDAVFLPGYYVFPGGSVNGREADAQRHSAGPDDTAISQSMSLAAGGADYMLAAIRECFEEGGILLAQDSSGRVIDASHPVHGERLALFREEVSLASLCQKHGLTLTLDRLAYRSPWGTPPGPPRRFDTRFFVAVAPEGQPASHDGHETISHRWVTPARALEAHRAGTQLLSLPTIRTLRVLSGFTNTTELMRYAHANPPEATPTDPWPALRKGRPVMLEPNGPAYDEAVKLDPEGEGTTRAEITPGEPVEIGAGVIRLTAPNPGMMTGPGTNTYILGHERFTVIDPGPLDETHVNRILDITGGEVDQILVTHAHIDHSPAARLLKERTGCRVFGWKAPQAPSHDQGFAPDDQPGHEDLIATDAGVIRVLHTPGHASNHLCFLLLEQELLFAGDHIMQGSTVVINPPDGDMKAYLESLYELLEQPVRFIAPAHGFVMGRPEAVIDYLITHRLTREHKIFRALEKVAPADLKTITATAYNDVPAAIHGLASRSPLAHLLKLEAEHPASEKADLLHLRGSA